MIDFVFDRVLPIFIIILLVLAALFLAMMTYDGVTGNWQTRVIEINNPEKRVVCFKSTLDRSGVCYPYELLDNERIKKYVEKK